MVRRRMLVAIGVAALAAGAAALTVARAGDAAEKKDVQKVVIFRSGGSWLGVQIADVDAARAKELGLKEEMGAEVQSVSPGSPAEEAGLKEGDVILEYQGTRIEGVSQLTRLVRETPSGRTATLKVFRDGSTRTVQAKVGQREHDGDMEKHIEISGLPHGAMHWQHAPDAPGAPDIDLGDLDLSGLAEMGVSMGRPRLGVTVDSVGKQLAEYFGVKQGAGVLVTSVHKDGAGATAGLKAGDVIVKVDDEAIEDASDLHMALRDKRDKEVRLTIVRDRREQTLTVPAVPESKSSGHPQGSSTRPVIDHEAISAQVRQALRDVERAQLDQTEVRQKIEEAVREAREAAREAAERAAEEVRRAREARESGAVEIKAVPEQERDDIRRAVEEGRRIRIEMQSSGGD